jgi:hypothetical protein
MHQEVLNNLQKKRERLLVECNRLAFGHENMESIKEILTTPRKLRTSKQLFALLPMIQQLQFFKEIGL